MSELIGDARCILHAQYDPSVKPPIIPQKRKRPKVKNALGSVFSREDFLNFTDVAGSAEAKLSETAQKAFYAVPRWCSGGTEGQENKATVFRAECVHLREVQEIDGRRTSKLLRLRVFTPHMIDWLIERSISRLIVRLIDWLIDWAIH